MKQLLLALLAAGIFYSCKTAKMDNTPVADNTLSSKEKKEGWQLLFDGKSNSGWHTYGYSEANEVWKVEAGALTIDTASKNTWPKQSNDLVTDEAYNNFDFQIDWKIAAGGNSGVILYVNEDKAKYQQTYQTGMEMQVLDNNGHPDAKIIKHRAGDLYDLISSASEPVKAAGEWNHAQVVANKGKLDFYLNGQHVINTTMWDDNWKKMIAGSKFKSMPGFGTFSNGKIALQEHGNKVWYKNIKIKKL